MSRFDANLLEDVMRVATSSQQMHPLIREHLLLVSLVASFCISYVRP